MVTVVLGIYLSPRGALSVVNTVVIMPPLPFTGSHRAPPGGWGVGSL